MLLACFLDNYTLLIGINKTFLPLGMGKNIFWPAMIFELCTPDLSQWQTNTTTKKNFSGYGNFRKCLDIFTKFLDRILNTISIVLEYLLRPTFEECLG